jgi:hypothetical protein
MISSLIIDGIMKKHVLTLYVLGEMRSWSWSWYIYLGNGDGGLNALSGYTSVDVHWTNTQSYKLWVNNQLSNKRNGNKFHYCW